MSNTTTEKQSFTPGPWVAFFEDEQQPCSIRGNGRTIAWVDFWKDVPVYQLPMAEQQANARLIAASPDLLEACRSLLALCEGGVGNALTRMDAARDAISKATEEP